MYTFDTGEIEALVLEFMRRNDCEPDDVSHLELDGQIHRYRVRGDKHASKNGAYCIFTDNWPAGWIQNWKTGAAITWSYPREQLDDAGKDWFSDERYKEVCRLSEEHQKQLRAELEAKQKQASLDAQKLWDSLPVEDDIDFPYLKAKDISGEGVRLWVNHIPYGNPHNDAIVVPLYNINFVIQSLQFIDKNGDKKFFTGAPVKGAFYPIGLSSKILMEDNAFPILLCEGFATAETLYAATGFPTVAAMMAGNLLAVAEKLKAKHPKKAIFILADNDRHENGSNPGMEKAAEAVKNLGLKGVIAPQFGEQ